MQAVSDEQLIEWVAQGDASCLGTLFERHNRSVYRFCRQLTRNSTQAEDLVQDIFLKILRKAGSYRRQGSFRAWMFNIARNMTLDQIRKAKRRGDLVPVDSSIEANPVDYRSAEVARCLVTNDGRRRPGTRKFADGHSGSHLAGSI